MMCAQDTGLFRDWLDALEKRHSSDLTFREIRRALQALSSIYVERRSRLQRGAAMDGAGKRAAFALFYGPLHYLVVSRIVAESGACIPAPSRIYDLGCGTGAAGAAWSAACPGRPTITGIDLNNWALDEARWTYRTIGLRGKAVRADAAAFRPAGKGEAILAAYTINELGDASRRRLLKALLESGDRGSRILIVEPIARRQLPWWDEWVDRFRSIGGSEETWKFREQLPESVMELDKAAGLDHSELKARTIFLP